jgi:hypothetical protein
VVFAAWQLVILAVTGSLAVASDGGKNAGLPFSAPLHALAVGLRHINTARFGQYDLWLLEFFGLVLACILAATVMRASRAASWEKLALGLYVIEICVVTPSTWSSLDADMRSFIEVYLFAVVILLSVPAGRLGARFGWALPVLAAWMILAVAVVAQRRLTMSFRALRPTPRAAPWAAIRSPVRGAGVRRSLGVPSVSCP